MKAVPFRRGRVEVAGRVVTRSALSGGELDAPSSFLACALV